MGAKWTPDENAVLRCGVDAKTPTRVMAEQLGRTQMAVAHQMCVLGLSMGRGKGCTVRSTTEMPQAIYTQARALAAARGLCWPDFILSLVEKELAK